jgi:hypothetical protein
MSVKLVHAACPEVQETMKWRCRIFDYHGIMLGWLLSRSIARSGSGKGELILGKRAGSDGGMGHFGKITALETCLPTSVSSNMCASGDIK